MKDRNRSAPRTPAREPALESLGDDALASVTGGASDISFVKRADKGSAGLLLGGPPEVSMKPAIRF